MWWTDERIGYYLTAASHTSFHEVLADEIAKHIDEGDTVSELGAGLGYVTERLCRKGIDIKGYDSCPEVVELCNERTGAGILEVSDVYEEAPPLRDVVLMIFFGRIAETGDLSYFMSLARKRIIYVISHHDGHAIKQRTNRKKETADMLSSLGLDWTAEDMTIPFDQPLRDEEDAVRFAEAFYSKGAPVETERSGYEDYPLLFRNTKNITIFTIQKEDGK